VKSRSLFYFLLLNTFIFLVSCQKKETEIVNGDLAIIPLPAQLEEQTGFFIIDEHTWIHSDSFVSATFNPIKVFTEVFEKKSGYALRTHNEKLHRDDEKHVILVIHSDDHHPKESYTLHISPTGIIINAANEAGVFYAFQTLRQMMRMDALPDANRQWRTWKVPAVDISDTPLFPYRGLHLDVVRHFMPVDFVKKYIDLLAYYKMNRFHWHLTDDQGWRIEIKKYPKLQKIAAWRDQTLIGHAGDSIPRYDGKRYGGYYTQDEIKEVVRYAADRGVMVIPEIEMPGHSLEALAAYPELSCTSGPFKVAETWGVFDDVYCPTEETFTFLQNVLDEVIALFPSPYIHIGGDECPKQRWKESEFCQALMKKEGLKDEMELQSYFIQRIEKYLNSKGKSIIGWDEILEGGIAPNATIMSWRGTEGGIAAAREGHDVIMTPGDFCYFDHYQAEPKNEPLAIGGLTTTETVYSFTPIPAALSAEEAKHILGAQGNLWTEYITTPDQAEYMAYPRAMSLAEVLWTPPERKSWPSFLERLNLQTDRLDGMKVNYAKHLIKGNPRQ
jgi:hexosaminidase